MGVLCLCRNGLASWAQNVRGGGGGGGGEALPTPMYAGVGLPPSPAPPPPPPPPTQAMLDPSHLPKPRFPTAVDRLHHRNLGTWVWVRDYYSASIFMTPSSALQNGYNKVTLLVLCCSALLHCIFPLTHRCYIKLDVMFRVYLDDATLGGNEANVSSFCVRILR